VNYISFSHFVFLPLIIFSSISEVVISIQLMSFFRLKLDLVVNLIMFTMSLVYSFMVLPCLAGISTLVHKIYAGNAIHFTVLMSKVINTFGTSM